MTAPANHDFAEWVKSTTFHISLCGWAITEILILQEYENLSKATGSSHSGVHIRPASSVNYLRKRGLITRCPLDNYGSYWVLTDAGRHVAALLRIAGFTTSGHTGTTSTTP